MKIALIDNGTTLLNELKSLIPGEEIVYAHTCNGLILDEYDVIILSGSSTGPLCGREDVYREELAIIRDSHKPIIGICFGCELIAYAFGMELEEMGVLQKGLCRYRVTSEDSIFDGRGEFEAYESHRWKVKEVREPFRVLANSEHGPAIIKHDVLPIYGLQFHPEHLTDRSFGDSIFLNILGQYQRVENQ